MIDEIKIMQYADGMLPIEEKEEVEKAIQDNPEYKKLLKDYQETGDLLFKLGAEIKSQPLPDSLKEKLKVIKSWKKTPKETKISFNFCLTTKLSFFKYSPLSYTLSILLGLPLESLYVSTSVKLSSSPIILLINDLSNTFSILTNPFFL